MAEKKYDLALVPTQSDKSIQLQPWYKERIQTKYIKSLKPGETTFKNFDGKNWRFLKDGLDDFRDGLPPNTDGDDVVLPLNKGVGPNIQHDRVHYVKQAASQPGRFNKEQALFSSLTPLKQMRRDNIDEIEFRLTQHPLALYPHLEECLSAEVFEDVVDLLDPQMNVASDTASTPEVQQIKSSLRKRTPSPSPTTSVDKSYREGAIDRRSLSARSESASIYHEDAIRNPYYWLPKREEAPTGAKKKYLERKEKSKAQEQHIHGVTQEFCEWVSSLGGETNNIEEATITSLFASGYETKPALSVPIHVVELSNVPMELRMSAAMQAVEEPKNLPSTDTFQEPWTQYTPYEPSWQKFHYGVWYMPPKTWKKRNIDDELRDPKEVREEEIKADQKKNEKLNQELADIHGSSAFMAFMDRKATRRPEFLDEIAEVQKKNAEEERRRLGEGHMAKMKRFPTIRVKSVM